MNGVGVRACVCLRDHWPAEAADIMHERESLRQSKDEGKNGSKALND